MEKYAVAILAIKPSESALSLYAGKFYSEAEALGNGYIIGEEKYPEKFGWQIKVTVLKV